jgi:hypothetical protein
MLLGELGRCVAVKHSLGGGESAHSK